MEVILLERIEKLGQMGDVVKVKDGYARNYLLPQRKALRANESNMAQFETGRVELEGRNLKQRSEAEGVGTKMDGLYSILLRQASEGGQLYGSVTSRDIADAVSEAGFAVTRHQMVLDKAIKTLGVHEIKVQLHPEVAVTVNINVARSEVEAEQQQSAAESGDQAPAEAGGAPEAASDAAPEDVHVEEFFEEEAISDAEAELEEAAAEDIQDDDAGDKAPVKEASEEVAADEPSENEEP